MANINDDDDDGAWWRRIMLFLSDDDEYDSSANDDALPNTQPGPFQQTRRSASSDPLAAAAISIFF